MNTSAKGIFKEINNVEEYLFFIFKNLNITILYQLKYISVRIEKQYF